MLRASGPSFYLQLPTLPLLPTVLLSPLARWTLTIGTGGGLLPAATGASDNSRSTQNRLSTPGNGTPHTQGAPPTGNRRIRVGQQT